MCKELLEVLGLMIEIVEPVVQIEILSLVNYLVSTLNSEYFKPAYDLFARFHGLTV